MKRLWLVGLAMALVVAFSASSYAVDLKVSGSFYAAGVYLDKINLKKEGSGSGQSTAFYYQRLRLKTEFLVTPGLSLVTSADIMERAWGAKRSTPRTDCGQSRKIHNNRRKARRKSKQRIRPCLRE